MITENQTDIGFGQALKMIKQIIHALADKVYEYSLRTNFTSLELRKAYMYRHFLTYCQRKTSVFPSGDERINKAAIEFHEKGVTSIWSKKQAELANSIMTKIRYNEEKQMNIWKTDNIPYLKSYYGDVYHDFPEVELLFKNYLAELLRVIFNAEFSIYYAKLILSDRVSDDRADGSQLWHTDGGPGICINILYYLHDVGPENSPIEVLPWKESIDILKNRRKKIRQLTQNNDTNIDLRRSLCNYYTEEIENNYSDKIIQTCGNAGLVTLFRNNAIHKGGFPENGHYRYACIFHCYPNFNSPDYRFYNKYGVTKQAPFPQNPYMDLH